MLRYTLKMYRDDMGTFTQPGCRDTEEALWHVNAARLHDGLAPLGLPEFKMMLRYPKDPIARATLTPEY